MRDILIIAIVAGWAVLAMYRPWLGVIGWTLLSIMNPHRYAWAASDLPLAAAVAIGTMAGLLITRDRREWRLPPPALVLIAFVAWVTLTLPFSFSVTNSLEMWQKIIKIDLMILVAIVALTTRQHVFALAWTLVASIGLYGFKGGIFTIVHGGVYRVWGPPGSFIEGNNEIALALVMTIPLMRFVQLQVTKPWLRHGLTVLMALSATAAIGTQSRGALLAMGAMVAMLLLRGGGKRLPLVLIIAAVGTAIVAFMPDTWDERMATIIDYQRDSSAMGRINAWWMAINLAGHNFFGGGFAIYDAATFARYAPDPRDIHAAHSIYFQVLGEQGYVGLGIFLLMWFMVWRWCAWLMRNAASDPDTRWAADLGALCQVSLVGYAVGGAFLSLAYFDLPYNILVLVVVARRIVEQQGAERAAAAPPVEPADLGALTRPAR